ncbi:putative zinc finger protein CONSTANS-LIKE 11 [Salvia miltiorrhiza]|uniref:putative zinc finger protein CONSTANS-LIKE 11 n=1 Tax=Salvia miltiorrhiza TaxID=226208 RepID=UPI0025AC18F0|nr:putative zinc finger protein CONSTANS-LIKE 11 [Salvia miltiorrhiza]
MICPSKLPFLFLTKFIQKRNGAYLEREIQLIRSMSKGRCELCSNPARMFCDSDQASLCWECDEKVHAANFLVAKHSRTLLCHVCHSPTPWKAAGPKLGPTVSVCHACAHRNQHPSQTTETDSDDDDRQYSATETDDSSEDEDEAEAEDVDENQVVPWSDSPPASADDEEENENENVSLSSSKRARDDPFPSSEDEDGCCSSENAEMRSYESESYENCSSSSLRPLKMRREGEGTAAIVEKLRRFEQQIVTVREESVEASAIILGLCNLTRD